MTKVNDFKCFLEIRGFNEENIEQVSRNTYKYTNCGAWCSCDEKGIQVGSIVEGSDIDTETHNLNYPFDIKDFWDALDQVEKEADQIWKEWNCEQN